MSLSYYAYRQYSYLMDDNLIKRAFDLLENRRKEFVEWIKDNEPACPKCGRVEGMKYEWNKKICPVCGEFDYDVPYPNQGGKTASRSLYQILKELFGMEMGKEKSRSKPSEVQMRDIPIFLSDFDTGEYSSAEVEFLNKRYQQLIESVEDPEGTDDFMFHMLVLQELKLKRMMRIEAFDSSRIDPGDKKKEFENYIKLAEAAKLSRKSRVSNKEKSKLDDIIKDSENLDINDIVKEYKDKKEKDKETLKLSKKRREESGNQW
jgi:hypothetical protein